MPSPTCNRWECKIVNPTDLTWSAKAPSIQKIKAQWDNECPNNKDFLNVVSLNRSSRNEGKNNLIMVYKIDKFKTYGISN
jgi:hypothetical protein